MTLPTDYLPGDTPSASELNTMLAALRDLTGQAGNYARYENATLQPIASGQDTKVPFPTGVNTSSVVTASGTNNTDFLLSKTGLWLITASVRYVAGSTGERHIFINTGTTVTSTSTRKAGDSAPGTTYPVSMSVTTTLDISSATSVHIGTYQSNGGLLNMDNAFGGSNHVTFTWLRGD